MLDIPESLERERIEQEVLSESGAWESEDGQDEGTKAHGEIRRPEQYGVLRGCGALKWYLTNWK